MPSHAVAVYGIRTSQVSSSCPVQAEAYSTHLSNVLVASWASLNILTPINIPAVLDSFKPKYYLLSEMADEYPFLRKIDTVLPKLALETCIRLGGDRDVVFYTREDSKLFVGALLSLDNKTPDQLFL